LKAASSELEAGAPLQTAAVERANGRGVEGAAKQWPKACACGETWSREHWGELTPVGRYLADEWIELRTCVCGKTLAVPTRELDEQHEQT